MSQSEIERFAKDVKTNASLQGEVKKVGGDQQALVNLAKKNGYDFTLDDLKKYGDKKKGELSQEDLDKVAGGGTVVTTVVVTIVVT